MMRVFVLLIAVLTGSGWIPLSAQDGSDLVYVKPGKLDASYVGRFAHLDFYNRSFGGRAVDTIAIPVNGKLVRFVERRKDDGYNNWFSGQYLESVEETSGVKTRIVKSRIDSITRDSVLVTNYLACHDRKGRLVPGGPETATCWFSKAILAEVLFKFDRELDK